jgi:hypothetical protein
MKANNFPPNCVLTYPTGSSTDYGLLSCGGSVPSAGYVWENVDFGPINGHGPTFVFSGFNATGLFTLQDFWWTNAVGGASGVCAQPAGTQKAFFYAESGSVSNFLIRFGQTDGHDLGFAAGSCRFTAMLDVEINTTGYASVEYNYFYNTEGLPVGLHVGATATSDIQFNVFRNWYFGEWQSHGEITGLAPVVNTVHPNFKVCYNTSFNDIGGPSATATTVWYLTGGVNGFDNGTVTLCKNASITNPVSGTTAIGNTAKISYQMGNSPAGGLGTGVGPYLTVTALSAGAFVLPGMNISDPNIGIGPVVCLSGCTNTGPNGIQRGGVGSIWWVACSVANVVCANQQADALGNLGCVSACYTISAGNFQETKTNIQLSDLISVDGPMVEAAHSGYTTIAGTGNLFDVSGLGDKSGWWALDYTTGPPWGPGTGNGGCTTDTPLTGNINLVGGASLNTATLATGTCF